VPARARVTGQTASISNRNPSVYRIWEYGNLGGVKTTIDLPDRLVIEAKKAAAERRTTLRALIERGLRRELAQDSSKGRKLRVVTADGGLPPGLDIRSRESMVNWILGDRS
jgi:hypothetical protein